MVSYGSSAVELEVAFGRGLSAAWDLLFKAFTERPRSLALVAEAVGPPNREVLAHMAAALVENSQTAIFCGGQACDALKEILETEFEAATLAFPKISSPTASILAEGSFSAAFLQALTAHDPTIEVWIHDALHQDAREALAQLLRSVTASANNKKISRSGLVVSSPSPSPANDTRPPRISLGTFIGEPGSAPTCPFQRPAVPDRTAGDGSHLNSNQMQNTRATETELCSTESLRLNTDAAVDKSEQAHGNTRDCSSTGSNNTSSRNERSNTAASSIMVAAAAVIAALCRAAETAPPGLCCLAAAVSNALPQAFSKESNSTTVKELLGNLLLSRWLVPALLTPGLGLGLGLVGAPLPPLGAWDQPGGVRTALIQLAKLLKAVASQAFSPEEGFNEDEVLYSQASAPGGADWSFVRLQARQLRRCLFDVLILRGHQLTAQNGTSLGSELGWSCGVVFRTAELVSLGHSLSLPGTSAVVAQATGLGEEVIRALGRRLPSGSITKAPSTVVCWLRRGELIAKKPPVSGHSCSQSSIEVSTLNLLRQLFSETRSICSPASRGVGALASLDAVALSSSNNKTETSQSHTGGVYAPHSDENTPTSVRAEPCSASAALAAALRTSCSRSAAWARDEDLAHRLKLELLEEMMHDFADKIRSNAMPSSSSSTAGYPGQVSAEVEVEERLMEQLSEGLVRERAALMTRQRGLTKLRVSERLLTDNLQIVGRCLDRCSKAAWELRWGANLQALWVSNAPAGPNLPTCTATFSSAMTPQLPDLCVIGPSINVNATDGTQQLLFQPSSSRKAPSRKTLLGGIFGAGVESGNNIRHQASMPNLVEPNPQDLGFFGKLPLPLQLLIQVVERSKCPCHRAAAVGASMGVDGLVLHQRTKHFPSKSLRQAVVALQQLPIESALQGDDPLSAATAITDLIEIVTDVIAAHCRSLANQQQLLPVSGTSADVSPEVDEWISADRLLQADERRLCSCVSRFIFAQLHSRIFPCEPTDEDFKVASHISRLAWLRPRHLDIPECLAETPQAARAAELLRRMHTLRCPSDMLDIMARAFRIVTKAACTRAQLTSVSRTSRGRSFTRLSSASSVSVEGLQGDAFGADESLPLFILVILRANPPMFSSVITYAERFTDRAQMLTEQGYALTQARAAVSFAATVRREDLTGLAPGEWERHLCADGELSAY